MLDGTFAAIEPALVERLRSERPHLFSDTPVYVARATLDRMAEVISAIERVIALPAYRQTVLARAPASARHTPPNPGAFYGYDFHLDASGRPRLIEINTNAGGALLNLALLRAQKVCCPGHVHPLPHAPDAVQADLIAMLREEWRLARGAAPLGQIAIVDDAPAGQYLYPEFLLFQRMLREAGIEAVIADAAALEWRDGRLRVDGRPVDMVYNRLTDFHLTESAHAALRAAWLDDAVVLTPHPQGHALYADKRNLALLSDADALHALGVDAATIDVLLAGVPHTRLVTPEQADALWAARKRLFFKPAAGYGGKAAYRGDKLTHATFAAILSGGYVAQERIEPSLRCVEVDGSKVDLKLDLRNYVYRGRVQLVAARLYQGQTTNFRTPGGGFAAVYVEPDDASCR
ncbi:MAG: hypothetical protein RBT51_05940 [Ectothiorhodospiraceae bacterium]|jgi:hypothetical protein|nr:hypothetical protein [Ectothiorhodospiraceae bacterium]